MELFKIIDKIRKQHTWKTLGTKENSDREHCALQKVVTSDYKTFIMGNTSSIIGHGTAVLFQVYNCNIRL